MRRHALGVVALLFMTAWIGLMVFGGTTGLNRAVAGGAMRIGLVLGAIWLALPQLRQIKARIPPWLVGVLALSGLAVAVRPKMAAYVLPVAAAIVVLQFVGWLFKPPSNGRGKTSRMR